MRAYELNEKIEKISHSGGTVLVYINPSKDGVINALKSSEHKELKGLMDIDGTFYFWDASKIIHQSMADKLGIDWRNMQHDSRIGIKMRRNGNINVSYENSVEPLLKNSKYFNNTIFKIDEDMDIGRDVHAIALNQTIPTERGMVPNPNITDWVVKTVKGNVEVGTIHKNEEGKFELSSDFGNDIFDTISEALGYVQTQFGNMRLN